MVSSIETWTCFLFPDILFGKRSAVIFAEKIKYKSCLGDSQIFCTQTSLRSLYPGMSREVKAKKILVEDYEYITNEYILTEFRHG